ncbi:molecular chaperone DnaK [Caviibacterium pharyngocola]|uniref:Molecular chaperone DnaK n=1 Tax=Caviibacterium pharyngocola TaxID=28159 RepID=A0A2M8RTA3_9PAST|nr:molecular chaperone DnaK [Caviibacterium pharyngocola]PJG82120.1 molecular chaperone DnaK [Caviibacterium pharyngocola]
MSDQLDRASEFEELVRQQSIQKHRLKMIDKSAVRFCIDCEDELPPLRQQMGCNRCVNCQTIIEQRQRNYKKG